MDYRLGRADYAQVPMLYAIMRRVSEDMPDPALFVPDSEDYLRRHIEERGVTVAAWAGDMVCAFQIVDFPGNSLENLGHDLGWPQEIRLVSAHMDSVCVLPEHRGRGLQKKLVAEAELIAASLGFRAFLSTIHPANEPSLKSLLALGYTIGATKEKYGGLPRHILYKHVYKHIFA